MIVETVVILCCVCLVIELVYTFVREASVMVKEMRLGFTSSVVVGGIINLSLVVGGGR